MTGRDGIASVADAVRATVCDDPDVAFAVLFGSRTTGAADRGSDVDLAIKFTDQLSARDRFRKWCFLAGEVQQGSEPAIDVSDIDRLPIDVAHDAVNGELLCGDADAFERCKARINTQFAAERDDRRSHQQAVIERIADEGLRG